MGPSIEDDVEDKEDEALEQLRRLSKALDGRLLERKQQQGAVTEHIRAARPSEQLLSDEDLVVLHAAPCIKHKTGQLKASTDAAMSSALKGAISCPPCGTVAIDEGISASSSTSGVQPDASMQATSPHDTQRTDCSSAAAAAPPPPGAAAAAPRPAAHDMPLLFKALPSKVIGALDRLPATLSRVQRAADATAEADAACAEAWAHIQETGGRSSGNMSPHQQHQQQRDQHKQPPLPAPSASAFWLGGGGSSSSTAGRPVPGPLLGTATPAARSAAMSTAVTVTPRKLAAAGAVTVSSNAGAMSATARRAAACSPQAKAARWAADDAETEQELQVFVGDFKRQQMMPLAALVLQCAWRASRPRVAFNRYMDVRRSNVHNALSRTFVPWLKEARATRHWRLSLQRRALTEWSGLVQLQTELCSTMLRALQRSALAKGPPGITVWRLSTADITHKTTVEPSIGAMLASIVQQQAPKRFIKAAFRAWRSICRSQRQLRLKMSRVIRAVDAAQRRERIRMAIVFWHRFSVTLACSRHNIVLPLFTPRMEVCDEWLVCFVKGLQLQQRADGLRRMFSLLRVFGVWRAYAHRIACMRKAFARIVFSSSLDLLRGGINAFKTNWKAEKYRKKLLRGVVADWRTLAQRNLDVTRMRMAVLQLADWNAKTNTIKALKTFTRMSQLMNAACMLKIWQRRSLALAAMQAWRGDTLQMWFLLCWEGWKRRALGRVRLQACIGTHLYRSHWLSLELAFKAWRKAARQQRCERTAREAAALETAQQDHLLAPPTPAPVLAAAESAASASTIITAQLLTTVPNSTSSQQRHQEQQQQQDQEHHHDDHHHHHQHHHHHHHQHNQEHEEQRQPRVHVSLADFPAQPPWRPLVSRRHLLAPRGLRAPPRARLAKLCRDLRELEGSFLAQDADDPCSLVAGAIKREAVAPGLLALVRSECPMTLLWRLSPKPDPWWWQRIVGLLIHGIPHPDSWKPLVHDHQQPSTHAQLVSAAPSADTHSTPDHSSHSLVASPKSTSTTIAARSFSRSASMAADEDCWEAEDAHFVHRLTEGEALLETVVHALLALGSDSSDQLYKLLREQASQSKLELQGDLLSWLLRSVVSHDCSFSATMLERRAARDARLIDGLELRERALALHAHIPHRFTLSRRLNRSDSRGAWRNMIERVNVERDWSNSSDESEEDDSADNVVSCKQQLLRPGGIWELLPKTLPRPKSGMMLSMAPSRRSSYRSTGSGTLSDSPSGSRPGSAKYSDSRALSTTGSLQVLREGSITQDGDEELQPGAQPMMIPASGSQAAMEEGIATSASASQPGEQHEGGLPSNRTPAQSGATWFDFLYKPRPAPISEPSAHSSLSGGGASSTAVPLLSQQSSASTSRHLSSMGGVGSTDGRVRTDSLLVDVDAYELGSEASAHSSSLQGPACAVRRPPGGVPPLGGSESNTGAMPQSASLLDDLTALLEGVLQPPGAPMDSAPSQAAAELAVAFSHWAGHQQTDVDAGISDVLAAAEAAAASAARHLQPAGAPSASTAAVASRPGLIGKITGRAPQTVLGMDALLRNTAAPPSAATAKKRSMHPMDGAAAPSVAQQPQPHLQRKVPQQRLQGVPASAQPQMHQRPQVQPRVQPQVQHDQQQQQQHQQQQGQHQELQQQGQRVVHLSTAEQERSFLPPVFAAAGAADTAAQANKLSSSTPRSVLGEDCAIATLPPQQELSNDQLMVSHRSNDTQAADGAAAGLTAGPADGLPRTLRRDLLDGAMPPPQPWVERNAEAVAAAVLRLYTGRRLHGEMPLRAHQAVPSHQQRQEDADAAAAAAKAAADARLQALEERRQRAKLPRAQRQPMRPTRVPLGLQQQQQPLPSEAGLAAEAGGLQLPLQQDMQQQQQQQYMSQDGWSSWRGSLGEPSLGGFMPGTISQPGIAASHVVVPCQSSGGGVGSGWSEGGQLVTEASSASSSLLSIPCAVLRNGAVSVATTDLELTGDWEHGASGSSSPAAAASASRASSAAAARQGSRGSSAARGVHQRHPRAATSSGKRSRTGSPQPRVVRQQHVALPAVPITTSSSALPVRESDEQPYQEQQQQQQEKQQQKQQQAEQQQAQLQPLEVVDDMRSVWADTASQQTSSSRGVAVPTVEQLVVQAAQAEWAQYERVAEQLADELADILQQRQPAAYVPPTTYHVAASTWARATQPSVDGNAGVAAGSDATQAMAGGTEQLLQHSQAGNGLDLLAAAVSVGGSAAGAEGPLQPVDALVGKLLTEPLATRYLFYQKVQQNRGQQQQLQKRLDQDPALAQALHQVAWTGLLQSRPPVGVQRSDQAALALGLQSAAPMRLSKHIGRPAVPLGPSSDDAIPEPPIVNHTSMLMQLQSSADLGAAASAGAATHSSSSDLPPELHTKLRHYMGAFVQWRQQQHAELLTTAELMDCVQEEEQVLDFVTALTLKVHQGLLLRQRGLLTTQQQAAVRASAPAFGSSQPRATTVAQLPAAAIAQPGQQQRPGNNGSWLQACGQGLVLPRLVAAERALLTAARQQPQGSMGGGRQQRPLVVVPGLPSLRAAAAAEVQGASHPRGQGAALTAIQSMPRELRWSAGGQSGSGRDSAAVLRTLSGRQLRADDSQGMSERAAEVEDSCSSLASWEADLLPL